MRVLVLPLGPLGNNVYLVYAEDTKEAVAIDPGWDADVIMGNVRDNDLKLRAVLATHGHIDHTNGVEQVRELVEADPAGGIEFALHREDAFMLEPDRWRESCEMMSRMGLATAPPAPMADRFIEDGDTIAYGEMALQVLHTPGHSPGSVSYYGQGVVFSGDTLFLQSVGRADVAGGNWDILLDAIREKLYVLPDETVVFPGHGSKTQIGVEKKWNPFVGQAANVTAHGIQIVSSNLNQ